MTPEIGSEKLIPAYIFLYSVYSSGPGISEAFDAKKDGMRDCGALNHTLPASWDLMYQPITRSTGEPGVGINGSALGPLLASQRRKRWDGSIDDRQYRRLSAVGMVWDVDDTWESRYS